MSETSQLVQELDGVIKLLEAKIPANIESPENQKLIRSMERDMAEYFRQLEQAIDWTALEGLYYKYVKPD